MKMVLVEFWDHCEADTPTWITREEAAGCELARCRGIGFLVHSDARTLVITQAHVVDEDTVAKPFIIAVSTIIRLQELTPIGGPVTNP
jgi:hypothetical protein